MGRVPWWAAVSAALAPVLLVGGWIVAAGLQPAGYSSVRDTISALAGLGATDRAVMTIGLAGLGGCHVITAVGLRPARRLGRLVLAIGGVATILVAAFPVPRVGSSTTHGLVAGIALIALAIWPALAWRRGQPTPWPLRPGGSIVAAMVLVILLAAFARQLAVAGPAIGSTERLLAGAEALWPLVVVLAARRIHRIARPD